MMVADQRTLAGPTWPLTPEQRAVLQAGLAPRTLRMRLDAFVDDHLLQDALAWITHRHGVLGHVFGQAAGYRGWRQQQDVGSSTAAGLTVSRVASSGDTTMLDVSAHPLVTDAGSLVTIASELAAYCLHQTLPQDDAFQYAQFIEWRQDLAEGEEAHAGLAYWTALLHERGAHQPPRLAWRRDGQGERAALPWCTAQAIDSSLQQRVQALADQLGVLPNVVLQAAWWSLLARLSGAENLLGGWRHDCRQDYDVMASALGVFDKVLPVFSAWPEGTSFTDGVRQLSAQLSAHTESQEYWPADDPPTRAHLAAGFSCGGAVGQPARVDAAWHVLDADAVVARANDLFEVALHVSGDGSITVSADPRHHGPQATAVLARHFLAWLQACVDTPSVPVDTLVLAAPATDGHDACLRGGTLNIGPDTVLDRVVHWARITPDAPALSCGQQVLAYAPLLDKVAYLAGWMKAQGAGPGTLVAVNLPRSIDGVVAMLAAWRCGAAWLPLEPDWPEARRQAVLSDARPVLVIDVPLAALPIHGDPTQQPLPTQSDVAYVLYTSGSTGTPKGVEVTHGALFNYAMASSQAMALGRVRRWALTGTVAADLGHTALMGALHHGACLVVAEAADLADGGAFARFLAREAIEGIKMVPSHLEALLDGEHSVVPALVVLGGEAASPALVAQIGRLNPGVALYNHYGPTETTVGIMVHAIEPTAPRDWAGGVPPLSQVLANGRVHVLDPQTLKPAAIGVLGELFVGGPQLCRGYLGQSPGDRFVPDPWQPGDRLYRTGDLACLLPEGGLRLAGRSDHQLKIRGFRVEPAEIEAALLSLHGLRQAVVMPHAASGELVAFVVAAEGAGIDDAQVRAALEVQLPSHMRPAHCVFLPELPRLGNGKVDRRSLVAMSLDTAKPGRPAGRPPADDLEFVLLKGMSGLLGHALGADDDFFEMGGHSLQVIKLVARLRKQLKVEVAPGVVFDHPSAAALALALRAQAVDATQLDRLAALQRQLAELSPEQRAALEQQARQQARQTDGETLTGS
jgi:amino acid adenylation domain-containing protein